MIHLWSRILWRTTIYPYTLFPSAFASSLRSLDNHISLEFCKSKQYSHKQLTHERRKPKGGRFVPITPECQKALEYAQNLPGESEFILHNKAGRAIIKDSYEQFLRRKCHSLGIDTTHNHDFRVAFNARLIADNLDGNERCYVLGHTMQTNERCYSFSDERKLDSITKKMLKN